MLLSEMAAREELKIASCLNKLFSSNLGGIASNQDLRNCIEDSFVRHEINDGDSFFDESEEEFVEGRLCSV